MNSRFSYVILFLLFTAKLFCQDIIIKKDSSKIEVKLLEVRPTEIKYKLFTYQEGPAITINKSDVAYVIYSNGQIEIFKTKAEQIDTFYYAKTLVWKGDAKATKKHNDSKLGDYIKFNLQMGIAVNESYINKPYIDHPDYGKFSDVEYFTIKTKSLKTSINAGINFLFGKSTFCKHIIGINYLQSKSEFHYSYYANDYYEESHMIKSSTHTDADYKTTVHFINVITGVRFIAFKKICIDNCLSINVPSITNNVLNGTITEDNYIEAYGSYGSYDPKLISSEITILNGKKTHDCKVNTTFSFSPKISYELNIKKQKIGIYISCNLAYKYNLTWYMGGITYYPFKKLR